MSAQLEIGRIQGQEHAVVPAVRRLEVHIYELLSTVVLDLRYDPLRAR
jgi:hypothetical protein